MSEIEVHYADGNWHAATLGGLIQLLVDAGDDVAATFRVIEDSKPDSNGKFIRHMEIRLIPNGAVFSEIQMGCQTVSKMLTKLLQKGIVQ
jgi:hypothetical protein